MYRCSVFLLFFIFLINDGISASRQKRCIVIQKQSGGHADSGEENGDEDYDLRKPQPKVPTLDRLQNARVEGAVMKKKGEVEAIPPELLKFKASPNMGMFRILKLKDRIRSFFQ